MDCQRTNYLENDAFFDCLKKDELQRVCEALEEEKYNAGECIIHQGDTVKHFSYIKEGLVKLHILNKGVNDQIVSILKPYDFMEILGIFFLHKSNYTFTALTPCVIRKIDANLIRDIIDKNANFGFALMQKLSAIANAILMEVMTLKRLNLKGKLAYILLKFSQDIYNSLEFDLPVTRKEIAEFAGVSSENVIRAMSEFKKDKIIDFSTKKVKVLEPKILKQISLFG